MDPIGFAVKTVRLFSRRVGSDLEWTFRALQAKSAMELLCVLTKADNSNINETDVAQICARSETKCLDTCLHKKTKKIKLGYEHSLMIIWNGQS